MLVLTDGKKAASIDMYTWKDGNSSNDYAPEFFEAGCLEIVTDEDGWWVTIYNEPVRKVDDLDECINNARQWVETYEPTDGEEAYADIDEIEITWQEDRKMIVHHVDIEVSNHLIKEAKNYSVDEFERYANELGWEDWMEEFTPEDDYISESQAEFIDSILREAFELAHTEQR